MWNHIFNFKIIHCCTNSTNYKLELLILECSLIRNLKSFSFKSSRERDGIWESERGGETNHDTTSLSTSWMADLEKESRINVFVMAEIYGETKHCLVTVRSHQKLYPCHPISQIEAKKRNTQPLQTQTQHTKSEGGEGIFHQVQLINITSGISFWEVINTSNRTFFMPKTISEVYNISPRA